MTKALKQISILFIALVLCFILIACAKNTDSSTAISNKILDLSTLPTSGSFTSGGFSQDTKVLNFKTGGENDGESHSLGVFDLRQYTTIVVYYGNDSQATDIGRLTVQTTEGVELASAECALASGWQDTATKVEIDISLLRNKEEIMLCLKDFTNGIVVYKIELVYSVDSSTRLPYGGEVVNFCGNGSDISTLVDCDYHKYLESCRYFTDNGFAVYNKNEKNGNHFATFTRGGEMIHVYWIANKEEINVIYSPSNGANLPPQKPAVDTGTVSTTFTQIKGSGDEVMGYVIQLADGSFLLYDGGNAGCAEELLNTLKSLKTGDDIIIRGWVLTVNDEAHIGCFKEFASKYSSDIKLETVFTAPVNRKLVGNHNKTYLLDELNSDVAKFDGAKICYVHTGMNFDICNVKLEILFTAEELYATDISAIDEYTGFIPEDEFGNTSLISRVSTVNTKVLMLSDCGARTARRLGMYYGTYIKSDICQVGEHGKGDIPLYIYNMIAAPVLYYPTTSEIYNSAESNKVVREVILKNPVTQKVVLLDSADNKINLDETIVVSENTEITEAYQYICPDGEIIRYYLDITKDEMIGYCKDLLTQGYEKYNSLILGDNLGVTLVKNSEMIHIYWYNIEKRMTVVTSEKGAETLPIKEKIKIGYCDTSVTQLKSKEVDGMGYVVQLADGSFVIYDGGNKNEDIALQLWDVLNEMKPEGSEIIIRAWIITVPHIDHYGVFSTFSNKYASQVKLETVMVSPLPDNLLKQKDSYMKTSFKEDVAKFEGAKICNLFAGMAFEYCDVAFEIFETYHDAFILSTAKEPEKNISVVSRIQTSSAKMLILSDAGLEQTEHMAVIWEKYIRSDLCQVSNNGRSDCPVIVYRIIKPNVVWYPSGSDVSTLSGNAKAVLDTFRNSKQVQYIFFRDIKNEKATLKAEKGY